MFDFNEWFSWRTLEKEILKGFLVKDKKRRSINRSSEKEECYYIPQALNGASLT